MNCIENIVKYILYIFNILFLICRILLIIMGSLMLGDMGKFRTFEQAIHIETIPIIIIVLGCLICVISFFGCFGAIRENICCTSIYATCMFILFCLQMALVVWVFVKHTDFLRTMKNVVQTAWKENNEEHGYPMDSLQYTFDCCGLNGYQDYIAAKEIVPDSCCTTKFGLKHFPSAIYMSKPGCQGICGILLIVLGSIMLSDMGQFKSFDQAIHTETIPIIIIVLGCVIFVTSFCGCCGAISESVFCSSIYAICMFILFCLQIALVVWIFVKRSEFLNTMSDIVVTSWNENNDAHGYPMDALQLSFKCCGLNSYTNYIDSNQAVPNSCCGSVSLTNDCPPNIYMGKPGCQYAFVNFWVKNMDIIRWGGIGVAIIELIAMTFACCVISGIRPFW